MAYRAKQFKEADVFMICVASNDLHSYQCIEKWRMEILTVETRKPIFLI